MTDQQPADQPDRPADDGASATSLESRVREALREVVDPEIRIDVVALGLIRNVLVRDDAVEIQMILTTPFCPYGGILVQQVKDVARTVTPGEVTVTMLDEVWSSDMMEGADLAEWGLL